MSNSCISSKAFIAPEMHIQLHCCLDRFNGATGIQCRIIAPDTIDWCFCNRLRNEHSCVFNIPSPPPLDTIRIGPCSQGNKRAVLLCISFTHFLFHLLLECITFCLARESILLGVQTYRNVSVAEWESLREEESTAHPHERVMTTLRQKGNLLVKSFFLRVTRMFPLC